LQKLRDVLKETHQTRADNRSDHFNRRKRKLGNLFPIFPPLLVTTRFLGADTVAGPIRTSNEFLKKNGPGDEKTEKGWQTKQNQKAESRT
jgi:hypothetical protein